LSKGFARDLCTIYRVKSKFSKILHDITKYESSEGSAIGRGYGMQHSRDAFHLSGSANGDNKTKSGTLCPLMNRVERQLTSTFSLLTQAGKLQLVNFVLSSLPTYSMCLVAVPVGVLEDVDRARRHVMCIKCDTNVKNKPLVAWRNCTRPKKKGGLGIINLRSQNIVLLLKFLDKFFNRHNIPWVNLIWNTYYSNGKLPQSKNERGSFWRKDLLKLYDTFKGIANCSIGNGSIVKFWSEVWNGYLLEHKFPRLF
jgi:hypothetical protein